MQGSGKELVKESEEKSADEKIRGIRVKLRQKS